MNFTQILQNIGNWLVTEGLKVVISLIVFWFFCKIVNAISRKIAKKSADKNLDKTLSGVLIPAIRKIVKFIAFVCVLGYLGVETSGIAAAITSIGLTVGLALQGSLANFAGGVLILVMRPYKDGDFIESSGISGTVEEISLFYTKLTTPDNKEIIIPNGKVAADTVINYSTKPERRQDLIFSVSYEQDVTKAKEIILKSLKENKAVLTTPEPFVNVNEYASSSINILVRFWTKAEDYWPTHFALLEEIKKAFDDNKIVVPFNQLDVHITNPDK